MQSNAIIKCERLKMLLLTPQYLASITQSTETQTLFLSALKSNQYTLEELLELIKITQDSQVKSLFIVHLLSSTEYLDRLTEQSVLGRLSNDIVHIPSRLNPLVHQLTIEHLTLDQINTIQPEAAVSILCSIPHFHRLKKEQIDALIGQFPHKFLIQYWINHYSLMPNAFFVLAHLTRLVGPYVQSEIKKMRSQKQEELIEHILQHLDLFHPGFKLLYDGDREKHLIQAIKHYLNGKQHNHYIIYIHQLAELLLTQNHPLSLEAIQLLLSLNKSKEFNELTKKTSDLTNYYLRAQAQSGDTEMFYTGNRLDSSKMNLLIQLKRPIAVKTEEHGFFHSWLYPATTDEPQLATDKNSNNPAENRLIQQLAKQGKCVKALDYYLLHFNGSSKIVSKLIQDYLEYCLQEKSREIHQRSHYLTAILMNRTELKRSVREALYTSFLMYPELYDEQIRAWLFKYDAERTIKHFGQQAGIKNYKVVIELCTEALKKLDAKKDGATIKITTQALAEAKLELELSDNNGFFTQLFHWLIRHWNSGWTGFFSPKLPVYVAPFYNQAKEVQSRTITSVQETTISSENAEITLIQTLTVLENKRTLQALENLVETLRADPKFTAQEELNLRNRINNLCHELILESKQNKEIESWLASNIHHFNANQMHLLELRLRQGIPREVALLVKQIKQDAAKLQRNNDASPLHAAITELDCMLPELHAASPIPEKKTAVIPELPVTLEEVTGMVSMAWSWAKGGVGGFFAESASVPAKDSTPNYPLTNMNTL